MISEHSLELLRRIGERGRVGRARRVTSISVRRMSFGDGVAAADAARGEQPAVRGEVEENEGRISADGDDAMIDFGAGDALRLAGTDLAVVDAADFLFG